LKHDNQVVEMKHRMWKMVLAYHLGDLTTALEIAESSHSSKASLPGMFGCHQHFFAAMTCVAAARSKPKRRNHLLSMTRKRLQKLRKFAKHTNDCLPMVHLIEAELAAARGDSSAKSSYCKSIALAGEQKLVNLQALACERSGLAMLELGQEVAARTYFDRALQLYNDWGAKAKVEQLRFKMGSFAEMQSQHGNDCPTATLGVEEYLLITPV
jgi:hypothetical protein